MALLAEWPRALAAVVVVVLFEPRCVMVHEAVSEAILFRQLAIIESYMHLMPGACSISIGGAPTCKLCMCLA